MDKHLIVYPISTGDELNIFSTEHICSLKIMDMSGNILIGTNQINGTHNTVNIRDLPGATYIIEVLFNNHRTGRSVFVKM